MKKLLAVILVLFLSGCDSALATTLTNDAGLVPADDSVYTAVIKLDAELNRIYVYLNDLYQLQAGSSAPTDNSTYDLWFDTTAASDPILKYYDGATWTSLVSPTAYSSGLTIEDAVTGYTMGMTLERDTAATSKVMINASALAPATIKVAGDMLQITSKITLDFAAAADDTYYIYPVQTGTTTAFTMSYHTANNGTDRYIGECIVASGVVTQVISYDSYEHQRRDQILGLVAVYRQAAQSLTSSPSVIAYEGEYYNYEGAFAAGKYTATRNGRYEFFVEQKINGAPTTNCVRLKKNGTTLSFGGNCNDSNYIAASGITYLAVGDYVEVYGDVIPDLATAAGTTTLKANSFRGRFLGPGF